MGKIVDEDTLKWNNTFLPDGTPVYEVTIRARAVSELGKPDLTFQLNLQLNESTYRNKEEMIITAQPTKDCYLSIFNLIAGDTLIQLFPNQLFQDNFIKADSLFIFPPHSIALEVHTPAGKDESSESIIAVATHKNIPFSKGKIEQPGGLGFVPTLQSALIELNRWLLLFEPAKRVEESLLYRVVK